MKNLRDVGWTFITFLEFENCDEEFLSKFGAGDEARTRNFQLGKLKFRSFIFNTYKIAQEKCACMRCIPCMHCLICVSLRDVCGTVCRSTMALLPSRGSLSQRQELRGCWNSYPTEC